MAIPGVGEIIGGGVGLVKSLFDTGPSAEELAAQERLKQAYAQLAGMPAYQAPALDYNPAAYGAAETPEAQTVSEDPNIRNAQIAALNSMLTRSNEGLTAEERRAQDLSRRTQEETTRGQEEAIINNMMARGLGGSGMEFALRQQAAQNAADTASQGGLARESVNANQKLAALNSLLSGSGAVRGQDYTANKGNADIINQFAMENSRRKNAINAANTELANQAQLKNKEAGREDYTNTYNADLNKRKALAGMDTEQSNFNLKQDVARGSEQDKIWGNVGNIAGGVYNAVTSPGSSSGNNTTDPNKYKFKGLNEVLYGS